MDIIKPILDNLGFNPLVFVMQIVLFILLWNVMNQLFWKPMLAHLRQRDQDVADAYRQVDATRHEMEALRADYQTRIAKIEAEARTHIQSAIKEAQTERERILAEARAQAEAAIQQGVAEMEREKTEALQALRSRMVGVALTAVDKALGSAADPVALRRSIEEKIATDGARN